jgi:hypothetical protein
MTILKVVLMICGLLQIILGMLTHKGIYEPSKNSVSLIYVALGLTFLLVSML